MCLGDVEDSEKERERFSKLVFVLQTPIYVYIRMFTYTYVYVSIYALTARLRSEDTYIRICTQISCIHLLGVSVYTY